MSCLSDASIGPALLATIYAVLSLALVVIISIQTSHALVQGRLSLVAASLGFIAALTLVLLSYQEHARSPRPSILIVTYLAITCLFDVAKTRTLWLLFDGPSPLAAISTVMVALKVVMILVKSQNKTKWLTWSDSKEHSPEETSGIFGLVVFYWLYRLFMNGHRTILCSETLFPLDQAVSASVLAPKLAKKLRTSSWRGRKWGLAKVLFSTLAPQLLPPIIPRLALLAASMCQSFLIEALLDFLQEDSEKSHGYGLIGATILTYGLLALSTALYGYFQERFVIMTRGCLITAIYDQTVQLELASSAESGVLTLMSTDISRIMTGFLDIHEYWASSIQVGLSCWLLQKKLGTAFVAPLVVVVLSFLAMFFLGKVVGRCQRAWMEAVGIRVGTMATAISQMKLIKMSGMDAPIKKRIQQLRIAEIRVGERWRMLAVTGAAISQVPLLISPVLAFATAMKTLNTTSIFVSISYLTLLAAPLLVLFQKVPQLLSAFTSLQRIQEFLERDTRKDYRISHSHSMFADMGMEAHNGFDMNLLEGSGTRDSCISICDGEFGWSQDTPVLKDVNISIPASCLTAVLGPVGSGKTTFCRYILGELPFARGFVHLSTRRNIGYCDQQPFLTNAPVRDNIVAYGVFDQDRYDGVVIATMLDRDIASFPQGDLTVIGSGGIALSGGQRQRVSMARALYMADTDLLVFDDVLSGLDALTESRVLQRVFGPDGLLRKRRATAILCTHNPRHIEFVDRVIRLHEGGRVTEEGLPASKKMATMPTADSQSDTTIPSGAELLATIPTQTETESQDVARKRRDLKVYGYYFSTAGKITLVSFVFTSACYSFFLNFPRIWLTFWSDDAARKDGGLRQMHSRGYYIGIYGLLQLMCLMSFSAAAALVLGPMIRQSGSILHRRALDTVVNASLQLFVKTDLGVITNLFSQDITLIDGELPLAFLNLVLDIFSVIFMGAVIIASTPWLGLTYPAIVGILYAIQHFYLFTSRQLRLLDLEAKSPLYSHFVDTLKGISTIRASGWTDKSIEKNLALLDRSQKPAYLLAMVQRWLYLMLNTVVMLIAIVLASMMTQLRPSSTLSGASLVTLMSLSQSLGDIVRFYASLETSIGAVTRLRNFSMQTPLEKSDGFQPDHNWPSNGSIEVSKAWASYGGKSSLILLLLGFIDPVEHEGVQGSDTVFLPTGSTVMENLDPGGVATPEQCREALEDLDLWQPVQLRGGLGSLFDESLFSHGQRQLFSLARVVLKRRLMVAGGGGAVLLLDEFSSSVDAVSEQRMMVAVDKHFSGCTVVMVAHRLKTVTEFSDRVFVIDRGQVVESGDPRVLGRMEGTWFASLLKASE
ncbi:ABC multidrug transporter [Grosmannia clavigera kw1407]|uniref:ABC multidrug transporter n=1 Tax=Grosmannia clavigera (strain kw1407 / UAMH 11150) TaxID=655863 RepID=F0XBF2_GROCL|nr:ABC multidrug transporter [Grosmannia clavigera kw1407]EFX04947.1 ABC multidrug transporter [Grosmannia clavigera kw1407]